MEGILLVDKPKGLTSHKVVQKIKTALSLKRAGHTGTLDPLATGILPVALGRDTRLIPFLEESQKVYWVRATLGAITDSYDADGKILETRDASGIGEEKITAALKNFIGEIQQTPPIYSAIKVAGRALYRWARKNQPVIIPTRMVRIQSLELLGLAEGQVDLKVHCSRGTYVRSLIHDLGLALGCGAHVSELKRLQSGPFFLDSAEPLDQILQGKPPAPGALFSPLKALGHLPYLAITDPEEARRIGQGLKIYALQDRLTQGAHGEGPLLLRGETGVLALIHVEKSGEFRFLRVFS